MTGQGKSYFTKNAIKNKNCFVFDVNNEYDWLPFEADNDGGYTVSRYFGDFNTFLNKVELKRNSNIIFEEATGFLKGQVGKRMVRIIIGKRHTKNNIFLLFHSINSVPPAISDICNYVVLFKTMDMPNNIKKSMSFVAAQCAWLKSQPDKTKLIIKTI